MITLFELRQIPAIEVIINPNGPAHIVILSSASSLCLPDANGQCLFLLASLLLHRLPLRLLRLLLCFLDRPQSFFRRLLLNLGTQKQFMALFHVFAQRLVLHHDVVIVLVLV